MRSYRTLILSGLLVTGIASNLKSFEYKNYERLGKFDSEISHLLAQQGETQKESRGSGRFAPANPLSDLTENNLLADAQTDKKESRGSGRFAPANPLPDLTEDNLLADAQTDKKESRGSGRFAPTNPQFDFSEAELVAKSKNRRRKVVIIYS